MSVDMPSSGNPAAPAPNLSKREKKKRREQRIRAEIAGGNGTTASSHKADDRSSFAFNPQMQVNAGEASGSSKRLKAQSSPKIVAPVRIGAPPMTLEPTSINASINPRSFAPLPSALGRIPANSAPTIVTDPLAASNSSSSRSAVQPPITTSAPPPTKSKKRKAAPEIVAPNGSNPDLAVDMALDVTKKRRKQEQKDKEAPEASESPIAPIIPSPVNARREDVNIVQKAMERIGAREQRRVERKQRRKAEKLAVRQATALEGAGAGVMVTGLGAGKEAKRARKATKADGSQVPDVTGSTGIAGASHRTPLEDHALQQKSKKRKSGPTEPSDPTIDVASAPLPPVKRPKTKQQPTAPTLLGEDDTQSYASAAINPSVIPYATSSGHGLATSSQPEQTFENARMLAETWIRGDGIRDRVEKHGMIVRKGTFSRVEQDLVKAAMERYMRENNLSLADLQTKVDAKGKSVRGDETFFKTIAWQVPFRPLSSVRAYVRSHHGAIVPKGSFTEEEDEAIVRGQMEGKTWEAIGLGLERRADDVRTRWRDHLKDREHRSTEHWTAREDVLLRQAIDTYCKTNGKPISAFDRGNEAPWTTISQMLGGRRSGKRCREHWQEVLNKRQVTRADGQKLRWGRHEKDHLLRVLATFPARLTLDQVPWEEVHAEFINTPGLDAYPMTTTTTDTTNDAAEGKVVPWTRKQLKKRFGKMLDGYEGVAKRDLGTVVDRLSTVLRKGLKNLKHKQAMSSAVIDEDGDSDV